ncbi:hypothetical protein ACTJKO_05320 [Curtobacterium sp. 22159]
MSTPTSDEERGIASTASPESTAAAAFTAEGITQPVATQKVTGGYLWG